MSLTLFMYLARSTMRTELAKAQWRLNASQQRHHIQMFNSPPVKLEKHLVLVICLRAPT